MDGPSIVAIGGGTGLPVVLRAVRKYAGTVTAIVTVADDGGSSGRLRRDLGILPPGDIRNCLVALADERTPMAKVFQYRFGCGGGIAGHSVGNLIIAALADIRGDFAKAIDDAAKILGACGRVLPSTASSVSLRATTARGGRVVGQRRIARIRKPIARIFLDPPDPPAHPETVEAILKADQVIVGPGSLYTSILPNLLVPEVREAMAATKAKKVFVMNVMTQPGETSECTALDHIEALMRHCGEVIVNAVLANVADGEPEGLAPAEGGRHYIRPCAEKIESMGLRVTVADVVDETEPSRHDVDKLSGALKELL